MQNNDKIIPTMDEARAAFSQAVKANDAEALSAAFGQMCEAVAESVRTECKQEIEAAREDMDSRILAQRGHRQLTGEERDYYQAVLAALRSSNPGQAITNLDKVLPTTTINEVFSELRANHPLLSKINFHPVAGNTKLVLDASGNLSAQWGELCDSDIAEISASLKVVDGALYKLSALMFVCKPGMELGPEWLDQYVREVLYEALATGLEAGAVDGTGANMPIGMTRDVSENVAVVAGAYPRKTPVEVTSFDAITFGNLLSLLAVSPSGKGRQVRDLILVVSPADYFSKVLPATTVMAPDGSYRNNVLPYPCEIYQSNALESGEAVLGIASRYFAAAGISKDGRIEYDPSYKFGNDKGTYLIKTYANGFPMDDNAFIFLDISNLSPVVFKLEDIAPVIPSDDATLAALTLGAAVLTPDFDPDEDEYTAATTNTTNVIRAVPANAGATIAITLTNTTHVTPVTVPNNSAITWDVGSNVVTVTVTAEDGTTTEEYEVTVTKS